MTLLRRVLGDALRGQRLRQRRTLREVSGAARVSLGYLSEVERGQKEASSELLASICDALDVRLSELLREVSDTMRRTERAGELARVPARTLVPAGAPAGVGGPRTVPPARRGSDGLPFDEAFRVDREPPAEVPARAEREPAPVPVVVDLVEVPAPAQPERAEPAERMPARFEAFGRDSADLDGIELDELDGGEGLGEVEVLLGLTDLLCHPGGGFGPRPMRGELAGAGAGVVA
jgi:transcriptional regulator with XRE-family HTH domain